MTLAETYREARRLVLKKYLTQPDKMGRSQVWKIAAIEEDCKTDKESTLVNQFLVDIDLVVANLVESERPTSSITKISIVKPKHEISVSPVSPATPPQLN